jgi:ABC-type nitrate/sulfonate/bicarbonate transport system substrate-binding protein
MLQSIYFPVRRKRSGILLAAAILLAALLAKPNASFPQSGDKVKIGLPDFSISFLSLKVAQSQRLFQSEGLEVDLIRISNPVAMIALLNKEIDYAASPVPC